MSKSVTFDEGDLALIEALQVAPRAPWSALSAATGVTPATAVRRWQRLLDAGAAWVTGTPGRGIWAESCLAYIDITCAPTAKLLVAEQLAADPHALSVDLTSGGSDLFVTVATPDLRTLARYLLERLDRMPGIAASRTRIATRVHTEGSSWRLGVLSSDRLAALQQWRTGGLGETGAPLTPKDRDLLVALGLDGRASYTALAEAASVSAATARRRTDNLLESSAVLLRTELATPLAGWPVSVILSGHAPAARLDEVARTLGRLRPVRLCATLAGTPSLVLVAWLRTVDEVHRFELSLARGVADLEIIDRRVVLRSVKRMGRLLSEDGRAIGVVPMDIWADPVGGIAPDTSPPRTPTDSWRQVAASG